MTIHYPYINNRRFKKFGPDGLNTFRASQKKGRSHEIHLSFNLLCLLSGPEPERACSTINPMVRNLSRESR